MTKTEYADEVNNDDPNACESIPANEPIMQTQFHGKYFCGRKRGDSFENVTRPNLNGECPPNTSACSEKTSPENTVCYSNDADCPITSIEFTKSPPSNSAYTVMKTGVDGISLVYSKTQANSLPITMTRVEDKPCLDPSFTSIIGY